MSSDVCYACIRLLDFSDETHLLQLSLIIYISKADAAFSSLSNSSLSERNSLNHLTVLCLWLRYDYMYRLFPPSLGKYLKHLSLSPRVPQPSLQPFPPPPCPSLPIIPSRGQEIPVPPPSSRLHFPHTEQAGTAPPAAGPRLSLRNPEVPSPQRTPNPLRLPRSRGRGGPETPSADPASSSCASGKQSGLNRPLPQSGKAL